MRIRPDESEDKLCEVLRVVARVQLRVANARREISSLDLIAPFASFVMLVILVRLCGVTAIVTRSDVLG